MGSEAVDPAGGAAPSRRMSALLVLSGAMLTLTGCDGGSGAPTATSTAAEAPLTYAATETGICDVLGLAAVVEERGWGADPAPQDTHEVSAAESYGFCGLQTALEGVPQAASLATTVQVRTSAPVPDLGPPRDQFAAYADDEQYADAAVSEIAGWWDDGLMLTADVVRPASTLAGAGAGEEDVVTEHLVRLWVVDDNLRVSVDATLDARSQLGTPAELAEVARQLLDRAGEVVTAR